MHQPENQADLPPQLSWHSISVATQPVFRGICLLSPTFRVQEGHICGSPEAFFIHLINLRCHFVRQHIIEFIGQQIYEISNIVNYAIAHTSLVIRTVSSF